MSDKSLSYLIKDRREELGLSISGLARRVGTSPATLHKYENGWQRFEVYTLRKIATALDCQLVVDLKSIERKSESVSLTSAVKKITRLFWDCTLNKSHFKKNITWVVERVLEYGSLEDVKILIGLLGRRRFLKTVSNCRFHSSRTSSFWHRILKREGIKCTKRSFQREAWPS